MTRKIVLAMLIMINLIISLKSYGAERFYSYLGKMSNGLSAAANENRKYGYVDINGKVIIPFIYDNATEFKEGVAVVTKCEVFTKEYLIDIKLNKVFERKYTTMQEFSEGYFVIVDSKKEKIGFMDATGKEKWIGKIKNLSPQMQYEVKDVIIEE